MFSSNTTQVSDGGYQISRSLRFNSADSTYLNRTPATAGNRKQWSWSVWFKIATVGTEIHLFSASQNACYIRTDSTLQFIYGATNYRITSQVFRDVGAWAHLVVVWDSPNATVADRLRFYINGVQVTAFSTNNAVTLNDDSGINSVTAHNIGRFYGGSDYFNGYMTEINFIDGQALTASSFGETNAQTGVWQPKAYSGSYGTNGFYLNFSDNSNTTAATLGKDYSGNGNNWTPNNFSVTAGSGNDSLVDSPTSYGTDTGVGGTVRGNYATLNPLNSSGTLANGNLDESSTTNAWKSNIATIGVTSGKWYWECTAVSNQYYILGVCEQVQATSLTYTNPTTSWTYDGRASKDGNGTNGAYGGYGATYTGGDVIGVALDMDAGTLTFYKNGASQGVAFNTGLTGKTISPVVATYVVSGSAGWYCNFGQRPFAYTAPNGFKALCTQNLPTPTIGATTATQAGKFFNPVTFTSPSGGASVSGVGFQPDFTWEKGRSVAESNALFNVLQGNNAYLISNSTAAEGSFTNVWVPNSDGFTIANGVLSSGQTYVSWNWKANGSGSTNTSGSITSTVSANTTSGFSVVTYTGTGANATVGHGLGVAPSMVICKTRTGSSVGAWQTYHSALGATKTVFLNLTDLAYTNSLYWNNTAPTSSVFSLGGNTDGNGSGYTMVAYCFAEVAGYSKFGSYTGNGSADGPFVFTGFRPAFVLTKRTDSTSDWQLMDDARDAFNVANKALFPNGSFAETTGYSKDFVSNGFKIRDSGASLNASGGTYIFMAFAENPFKYSLAR